MKGTRLLFGTICMILVSWARSPADSTNGAFSNVQRDLYLNSSLRVFRQTKRPAIESLYQFVSVSEKNKCKSLFENLELNCLRLEAERNCSLQSNLSSSCLVLSDVIIVNKMNEKFFVTNEEKLKISDRIQNYSMEYGKILFRKYALLATDFLLATKLNCKQTDQECLAENIDNYCARNADVKNVSWQACAAALIWFIQ